MIPEVKRPLIQQNGQNMFLQRFYLCLGVCFFILVFYFSYIEPKKYVNPEALLSTLLIHTNNSKKEEIRRPNVVLVLTDDQDVMLSGAQHMPSVEELLMQQGTVFSNAFVASPLCCPSRSSILTGRYVHNHGALNNSLDGHCSDRVWQTGPEKETVAVHLAAAGYRTLFAGKYLNQYGTADSGGPAHVPPGWQWWLGLVGNSRYYDYSVSVNGTEQKHGHDPNQDYFTSVIERNALEFLDTVASGGDAAPFFMMLSTPACHAPFTPEPQYNLNFSELSSPRTPNFNIKNDESKHWLLRLGEQPLREEIIDKVDEIFRNRLRTLLTVDDMVKNVLGKLEEKQLLEDTYIIFTSDNGFHLGQFSLPYDKRQPYEFDIRVPFVIRGPGIEKAAALPHATSNVDLAPTILELAGVEVPPYMDGLSLRPLLMNRTKSFGARDAQPLASKDSFPFAKRSLLVEHSGEGGAEPCQGCESLGAGLAGCTPAFDCKCSDSCNSSFSCARQLRVRAAALQLRPGGPLSVKGVPGLAPGDVGRSSEDDVMAARTDSQHNKPHSLGVEVASEVQESVVFCRWSDHEKFVEFYDLLKDASQLHNARDELDPTELSYYQQLLDSLVVCSGQSCLLE